ncbi:MAG TPA: hypothetical protein PLT94_13290 [Rhodocyclaceae bacterium]|nr:hypothetical protein [Rhodocyclaceae bacterium]HNB79499.1 hypothetical protein [Rhodocyclaceae bacterium]
MKSSALLLELPGSPIGQGLRECEALLFCSSQFVLPNGVERESACDSICIRRRTGVAPHATDWTVVADNTLSLQQMSHANRVFRVAAVQSRGESRFLLLGTFGALGRRANERCLAGCASRLTKKFC